MFDAAATADDLAKRLEAMITRLSQVSTKLDGLQPGQSPKGDEWGPREILAHLRASDDVLIPRIYQILARDNPPMPAFDVTRWAEVAGYLDDSAEMHASRLAKRWQELRDLLAKLPDADWQRQGMHEDHGEISLTQVVTHVVDHGEEHLATLESILRGADAGSGTV